MTNAKGRPFTSEEKKIIVTLKQYFDRNKSDFGINELSVQMVADALDIGVASVNRIIAAYNKDPESISAEFKIRGRPNFSVNITHQEAIRDYIRLANQEGKHITVETIRDYLKERDTEGSFDISTLRRTLDRWGFEFGKGTRTQHLKEKDYVVTARRRYLRRMRKNHHSVTGDIIRPEVYLDETYINKNYANDFTWYSSEDGPWIQKPSGSGERLIIVNAITKDGWVPDAQLVFKSTRKTGDYHGQMNGELFEKWFREKLLPNIPSNSIIVMDNAPYHNILSINSAPTPACSKERIISWLEANNVPCNPDCLKAELIEILKRHVPEPIYIIDEIAKCHNHEIIRTPPYHPELQPIEVCWGVLKGEMARNCNFTMDGLQEQLSKAFGKVTIQTCEKILEKVRKTENAFWEDDFKLDESYINDSIDENS